MSYPVYLFQSIRYSAVMITLATSVGCTSTTATDSATPPKHLSLQLHMSAKDHKYTYFELSQSGELSFGGGRSGMLRKAKPVTTLSAKQVQAIWDVIRQNKLLDAEGEFFPDSEQVKWELMMRTDPYSLGHTVRTSDNKVPGIKELHDLLFKFQADVRYSDPTTGN